MLSKSWSLKCLCFNRTKISWQVHVPRQMVNNHKYQEWVNKGLSVLVKVCLTTFLKCLICFWALNFLKSLCFNCTKVPWQVYVPQQNCSYRSVLPKMVSLFNIMSTLWKYAKFDEMSSPQQGYFGYGIIRMCSWFRVK